MPRKEALRGNRVHTNLLSTYPGFPVNRIASPG